MSTVPARSLSGALLIVTLIVVDASSTKAQTPGADSLERWIRSGFALSVDSGQTPQISARAREVWGELGWSGVGYGFRTFAAREAGTMPSLDAFSSMMDYYRVTLDELHTQVVGDIGLAWGVHTEEFKVRNQPAETVRVRFTNTLKWDGTGWKNLLYHRDAQAFDANGRYIRTPK